MVPELIGKMIAAESGKLKGRDIPPAPPVRKKEV
jgi:hypothetical protein